MCDESGLFGLTQTPQQSHPLSLQHEPLHGRAKGDPKAQMLDLESFLRKGVSLGHVGRNSNLKDLKDHADAAVAEPNSQSHEGLFLALQCMAAGLLIEQRHHMPLSRRAAASCDSKVCLQGHFASKKSNHPRSLS